MSVDPEERSPKGDGFGGFRQQADEVGGLGALWRPVPETDRAPLN
jgi:hypothetical protein